MCLNCPKIWHEGRSLMTLKSLRHRFIYEIIFHVYWKNHSLFCHQIFYLTDLGLRYFNTGVIGTSDAKIQVRIHISSSVVAVKPIVISCEAASNIIKTRGWIEITEPLMLIFRGLYSLHKAWKTAKIFICLVRGLSVEVSLSLIELIS